MVVPSGPSIDLNGRTRALLWYMGCWESTQSLSSLRSAFYPLSYFLGHRDQFSWMTDKVHKEAFPGMPLFDTLYLNSCFPGKLFIWKIPVSLLLLVLPPRFQGSSHFPFLANRQLPSLRGLCVMSQNPMTHSTRFFVVSRKQPRDPVCQVSEGLVFFFQGRILFFTETNTSS